MSKWKNRPDGRTVRRQKILAPQWAWLSIEALESPAYRALSLSGHRVLARIQIEHAHHAGKENGKLPVTFRDFHKFEITPTLSRQLFGRWRRSVSFVSRRKASLAVTRNIKSRICSPSLTWRPTMDRRHLRMIGDGTKQPTRQKLRLELLVRSTTKP